MEKVKCATCGYLGSRNAETWRLEETDESMRERGKLHEYFRTDHVYHPTHGYPNCSQHVIDLVIVAGLHYEPTDRAIWEQKIIPVIQQDRECKKWVKWIPGRTPQEHRQMEFEDKVRKSDRRWHIAELVILVAGNLMAGALGALLVWLVSNHSAVTK
jgi:hypothetical protein